MHVAIQVLYIYRYSWPFSSSVGSISMDSANFKGVVNSFLEEGMSVSTCPCLPRTIKATFYLLEREIWNKKCN